MNSSDQSEKMTEGRGPVSECALVSLRRWSRGKNKSSAGAGGAKLAGLWPSEKSPRKEPRGEGRQAKHE